MTMRTPDYDVFLAHSVKDANLAKAVAERFREAGLVVFSIWDQVASGQNVTDSVWEAMAESAALVLVITSQSGPVSSLAMEVGAANAWGKPVYVVVEGTEQIELPTFLRHVPVFSASRLPEVIASILRASKPLEKDQQQILMDAYAELELPVETVLTRPGLMDQLAEEFKHRAGIRVPGEKLARELLRLRKNGSFRAPAAHAPR
jgi:hypothetical protein